MVFPPLASIKSLKKSQFLGQKKIFLHRYIEPTGFNLLFANTNKLGISQKIDLEKRLEKLNRRGSKALKIKGLRHFVILQNRVYQIQLL